MAVRKELELHVLTVGGTQIGIDQSVADYQNIGDVVGIKKAPENNNVAAFMKVSEVQRNGLAVRISCRLKNKKTNSVLCAIDKLNAARAALKGKTLGGSTIVSVTIPRKRSRR